MLNVTLRGTVLYEKERQKLLRCGEVISEATSNEFLNAITLSAFKHWNQMYMDRRLAPWKKFFYLQVHLASTQKIDENFFRSIGTSITWSTTDSSLPGYHVVAPKFDEGPAWQAKLRNLDLVFSGSYLPVPRLSEVADMDEVFAVIRIPYSPPENGFPDLDFVKTRIR
jgi:hypothetical protein